MVEAEAQVEEAIKASEIRHRDRRRRLLWTAATASSYGLDGMFLGLFVVAGTIPAFVFYVFIAGAAAICGTTVAMYGSGLNLRFRDQSLIMPQVVVGVAIHLTVVALAPQIAFPFLANLFTVFAFGVIWLSLRASIAIWSLTVIATGAVMLFPARQGGMAAANAFEICLTWLMFSLVLGRCLVLSVYANDMRSRLAGSRRKLAESLEQVQQLASHDELTGALNRRSLLAALDRERIRAQRSGATFSIAMIDLDHFKRVNDTHGHVAGDEVLRALATRVHKTMRATDVLGRYGGEEFTLIMVGAAPELAQAVMERIRAAVAATDWSTIAPGLSVTLSAGVASYHKGETIEQLLRRADQALYQAKGSGRNTVIVNAF